MSDLAVLWQELFDENHTPYYFNTATKETQWERPESLGSAPLNRNEAVDGDGNENDKGNCDGASSLEPQRMSTCINTYPSAKLIRVATRPNLPPHHIPVDGTEVSEIESPKHITKFVRAKSVDEIIDMLENGTVYDIDVRDKINDGYTCLMHQSGWGTVDSVEFLLEQNPPANIDLQSFDYSGGRRDNPILLAVANNRVDILKVLLEYGADRSLVCGKNMLTPLEFARKNYRSHYECLRLLETHFPECRSQQARAEKAFREEGEKRIREAYEAEQRVIEEAKRLAIEKRKEEMRLLEEKM